MAAIVPALTRIAVNSYAKSIVFNGTSDSLTIPVTPGTTFSVCFWVLRSSSPTASARMLDWTDAGPNNGFNIIVPAVTNTIECAVRNVGANTAADSLALGSANWTHIAMAFDGANVLMYVNGTKISPGVGTMTLASATFTMGKRSTAASNFFAGQISDFFFFNNTVLTMAQFNAVMTRGIVPSTPTVHYTFDNNANDSSGNGNNATLSGTSYSTNLPCLVN